MSRVAVIGDIAGHAADLRRSLIDLGADVASLDLPDDLTVIQVGDLVHRGPDSLGVLQLVRDRQRRQPEQWVQLVGNHEGYYLGGQRFQVDELGRSEQGLLHQVFPADKLTFAAAVQSADHGDLLVTHAGLTAGVWEELGCPSEAANAADRINWVGRFGDGDIWRAGQMLGATPEEGFSAGVTWAEAGREVYLSWLAGEELYDERAPFSQIHGHTSPWNYLRQDWREAPEFIIECFNVDCHRRHTYADIAHVTFIGVDPCLGRRAGVEWAPLLLEDSAVTTR